jgi:hypothetical protein
VLAVYAERFEQACRARVGGRCTSGRNRRTHRCWRLPLTAEMRDTRRLAEPHLARRPIARLIASSIADCPRAEAIATDHFSPFTAKLRGTVLADKAVCFLCHNAVLMLVAGGIGSALRLRGSPPGFKEQQQPYLCQQGEQPHQWHSAPSLRSAHLPLNKSETAAVCFSPLHVPASGIARWKRVLGGCARQKNGTSSVPFDLTTRNGRSSVIVALADRQPTSRCGPTLPPGRLHPAASGLR